MPRAFEGRRDLMQRRCATALYFTNYWQHIGHVVIRYGLQGNHARPPCGSDLPDLDDRPSRPTAAPVPIDSAEASDLISATTGRIAAAIREVPGRRTRRMGSGV
jgi:hypothetical protein